MLGQVQIIAANAPKYPKICTEGSTRKGILPVCTNRGAFSVVSATILAPMPTRIANHNILFFLVLSALQRQKYATAPVANPESPPYRSSSGNVRRNIRLGIMIVKIHTSQKPRYPAASMAKPVAPKSKISQNI